MTASDLLKTLRDSGVAVRADGDQLRLSPVEAIPRELIDELRRRKPEILSLLAGQRKPLTAADRLAAYDSAVSEANRQYAGGPIDWPAVDAAAERILTARTREELDAAVQSYVVAVGGREQPPHRP